MTLIIGIESGNDACIAADIRYEDGRTSGEYRTGKIVKFAQDGSDRRVLFAVAGSSRVLQVVRAESLRMARAGERLPSDDGYGTADWTAAVFIPWLHGVVDASVGPSMKAIVEEDNFDGVLARHGDVVEINSTFAVHHPYSGHVAVGRSLEIAYGSLETTALSSLDAVTRARAAMEATAAISPSVRGWYTVARTDRTVPDETYTTEGSKVLNTFRQEPE